MAALAAGQRWRTDFNKITGAAAYTAGRSYDMSSLGGHPIANAWAGTSLTFTECDEATGNGTQIFGIRNGGNVSADVKNLLNMGAITTAATGVPSTLLLVDIEGYWPGISNNTTSAQSLSGTPSLRATNGNGCRLYWVQTATAGATAQNINVSYTDQSGNTGNTLPVTVAMTASAIAPHISHSGTAANNYGPFLPLASGDYGVRNVASVTFSAANTGTGALVLAKPLMEIPIGVVSLYHNKDMLSQIPSLPVIPDGACLAFILIAGGAVAASTTFAGHTEFVWD
jgi:hypothetical protein